MLFTSVRILYYTYVHIVNHNILKNIASHKCHTYKKYTIYESIKDYQYDFFADMKNEIISQINDLVEERSSYQNKISTKEEYDEKNKRNS